MPPTDPAGPHVEPRADTPLAQTKPPFPFLQYALVLAVTVALLLGTCLQYEEVLADAHKSFLSDSMAKSTVVARTAEHNFNRIYRSLRMMARLPAIQAIDSHAKNLGAEERTTVQEVYNNLVTDVAVSNISIYLDGFRADAIDPVTSRPQQPVLKFDELIIGRPNAEQSAALVNFQKRRVIERQIAFLKARYPLRSSFRTLDNPAVSSPKIVIGGPGDLDRFGIVYSIPFYGLDGRFRGVISAAISIAKLKGLLPDQTYAFVNDVNGFSTSSMTNEKTGRSRNFDVVRLNIRDLNGAWSLHAARNEAAFSASGDALDATHMAIAELTFVVFLSGLLFYAIGAHFKSLCVAADRQSELDRLVRDRTFELEGQRQKFRDFAETTSDWFWETDESLAIKDVSDNFAAATGIPKDQFTRLNLADLEPSDQHTHLTGDARELLARRTDLRNFYVVVNSPARGKVYLRMAARAVRGQSGEFLGYRGTSSDITAGLARARAAQQGQKLQALGSMSAGLAHEFNNILSIVMGYTESLKSTFRRDADTVEQLDQIAEAGRRGTALSKSLLSFGRSSSAAKREIFNVRALGVELPHLLKPLLGAGYKLTVKPGDRPLWVEGERDLLIQGLVSLVVNARDAMPGGGEIALTLNAEQAESGLIRKAGLAPAREYISICVADHGEGMNQEAAEKLFEPVFSSKRVDQGLNMGLSSLRHFAKGHHGHVAVASALGRGTSVTIILPASPPPAARAQSQRGGSADFTGMRVLLVDDEPQLLTIFQAMLRDLGFDVVAHSDLDVALELLDDEREKFDVVVSDVLMPQMSGFRFAALARSLRPSLNVLFVSGQPERGDDEADPVPKDAMILSKPFDRAQLSAALGELLHAQAAA
jgi:PAS domain S-box-containing protein